MNKAVSDNFDIVTINGGVFLLVTTSFVYIGRELSVRFLFADLSAASRERLQTFAAGKVVSIDSATLKENGFDMRAFTVDKYYDTPSFGLVWECSPVGPEGHGNSGS